jgi:hypothetical protein
LWVGLSGVSTLAQPTVGAVDQWVGMTAINVCSSIGL